MRYHGVDLHKRYATVSTRDEQGVQQSYVAHQRDMAAYVAKLGREDVVVVEACSGAFYWAERIEERGARCLVIDAYRFRVIRDSWNKSDRRDAANLSLALWMAERSQEMRLPEVWQPGPTIRELRRLLGHYQLLNKQVRQLKNEVHGIFTDNGGVDPDVERRLIEAVAPDLSHLEELPLTEASRTCVRMSLELLGNIVRQKDQLRLELYRAGRSLEREVRLLIGIRGITPLLALVFLAEVGDVGRFSSARKLVSYLGTVPRTRSSGGITHTGAINRASRSLARTLFTQAIPHVVESSPELRRFYLHLADQKGFGRARMALVRRLFVLMRAMLLQGTPYRWLEPDLYARKVKQYERALSAHQKAA